MASKEDLVRLAKGHDLPAAFITETTALVGMKGSGKTFAAGLIVEEVDRIGVQVVVIDPVGTWWGLRLAEDGVAPGLDLPVIGGDFGDIPLPAVGARGGDAMMRGREADGVEKRAGRELARLTIEHRASCVIDVSDYRKAGRRRFLAGFAEEFFHLKKRHRSPVLLVVEEARVAIPQKPRPGEEEMLGAFEDIARRGRNYGIGMLLIDQRPQSVNKDVMNQAQNLIAFQLVGAHERKAIREWVTGVAAQEEGAWWDQLAELRTGEAFVWSPGRRLFTKVAVRRKWTYDSSKTPEAGSDYAPPAKLSDIDVGKISAALAATIERAKEEDPKELKRQVADLKRQLAQRPAATEPVVERVEVRVEVPVFDAAVGERVRSRLRAIDAEVAAFRDDAKDRAARLATAVAEASVELDKAAKHKISAPTNGQRRPAAKARPRPVPVAVAAAAAPRAPDGADLDYCSMPEQQILNALAWLESIGVESGANATVAFLAGYSHTSTSYTNPRGSLRGRGLVTYPAGGRVALTHAGRDRAAAPDTPLTDAELHEAVLDKLGDPERRLLAPLIQAHPESMTNDVLADAAGYSATSTSYTNPRGRLRTMGLVEYPASGTVRAAAVLFIEGKA